MLHSEISFFVLFAVFFLLESINFSERNTLVFYSVFLRKWNWKFSSLLPQFGNKKLFLKNPLPPLGSVIVSGSPPFVFTSAGFMCLPEYLIESGEIKSSFINYGDVKKIAFNERDICINGQKYCRLNSEHEAEFWTRKFSELVKSSNAERERVVSAIFDQIFDTESISKKISIIFKETFSLRIILNILYLYVFVFSPFIVYKYSISNSVLYLLSGLITLQLLSMLVFVLKFYRIFTDRKFPLSMMISALMFPPGMIRSIDYFFKDVFVLNSPLALSYVISDRDSFIKLASELSRFYTFTEMNSQDPISVRENISFNSHMLNYIGILAGYYSISVDELMSPLAPFDGSVSYCPKCLCQYVKDIEKCKDCGVRLLKY